jgi:hypothetical protein
MKYKKVGPADCEKLKDRSELGKNFKFFIEKSDGQVIDLDVNLSGFTLSYINKNSSKHTVQLSPSTLSSLCSVFELILSDGWEIKDTKVKEHLTLWQKDGGWFGSDSTALVYHEQPTQAVPTQASLYSPPVAVPPAKSGPALGVIGGTVLLLTVAGLAYFLLKRRRDLEKKKEMELVATKAQVVNAAVERALENIERSKSKTPSRPVPNTPARRKRRK